MASSKISDLTNGTSAQLTTDRIPAARSPYASGDNVYLTPEQIRTATGGALAGTKEILATGAVVSNTPIATWSQTWNNSGVSFTGLSLTITDTASASGSDAVSVLGGASGTTNLLGLTKGGTIVTPYARTIDTEYFGSYSSARAQDVSDRRIGLGVDFAGLVLASNYQIGFSYNGAGAGDALGVDTRIYRAGTANSLLFGDANTSGAGSATTRTCINKAITGIADNTATTAFTVTVPNAAHSASIRVRLTGSSGAGGAVGANESTQDAEYMVNVARTAGVNAVATIGAVVGQAAASTVTSGNAVAVTGGLSAISGAVGASNTFTIQVTIARAGGSATNHTCLAFAELLNANSSGVTIA